MTCHHTVPCVLGSENVAIIYILQYHWNYRHETDRQTDRQWYHDNLHFRNNNYMMLWWNALRFDLIWYDVVTSAILWLNYGMVCYIDPIVLFEVRLQLTCSAICCQVLAVRGHHSTADGEGKGAREKCWRQVQETGRTHLQRSRTCSYERALMTLSS